MLHFSPLGPFLSTIFWCSRRLAGGAEAAVGAVVQKAQSAATQAAAQAAAKEVEKQFSNALGSVLGRKK